MNETKERALAKWQAIIDGCKDWISCSYCRKYKYCKRCPIHDAGYNCCKEYANWVANKSKRNAQAMYDRILALG